MYIIIWQCSDKDLNLCLKIAASRARIRARVNILEQVTAWCGLAALLHYSTKRNTTGLPVRRHDSWWHDEEHAPRASGRGVVDFFRHEVAPFPLFKMEIQNVLAEPGKKGAIVKLLRLEPPGPPSNPSSCGRWSVPRDGGKSTTMNYKRNFQISNLRHF